MSVVQPKSLEEATQIVRAWRDHPGETRLPEDYEGWHFEAGIPIDRKINFVKLAILTGYPIPEGFKHWCQVVKKDDRHWQSLAHWAAEQRYPFPADFFGWNLLDSRGIPVIQAFMRHAQRVPEGFCRWDIQDKRGVMTAHAYLNLVRQPLPPSFTQWDLRDADGQTVAHHATLSAHFYDDDRLMSFGDDPAIWQLRNDQGDMVLHVAVRHDMNIPETLPLSLWHEPNEQGKTAIAMAREYDYANLVAQYEALKMCEDVQVREAPAPKVFRSGV